MLSIRLDINLLNEPYELLVSMINLDNSRIGELCDDQKTFFKSGATLSISDRIEALKKLQRNIEKYQDEILEALSKDMGKPALEAYVSEYHFVLTELRLTCKKLKKWLKPERVSSPFFILPTRSRIVYKPFGCALIIAPWNYPFQLAFAPFIAAIAAGNTVVLKPSEATPHCELIIKKIIEESFAPERASVVLGDSDVSQKLLGQKWDFIFFTGSSRVGRIVSEAASKNLTPTILELGGKCPCVVDSDIDLEATVQRILMGKFFNGGQTCVAPDFVVVHESIKKRFIESLKACLEEFSWEQDLTNMIDQKSYERVLSLISGDVISKGEDNIDHLHLAPRIMPDVEWGDQVMQEEVFGPVLPVLTFKNHDDLIEKLNDMPSPLAVYYFGRDKRIHQRFVEEVQTGGICINDTMKHLLNLKLPFGGVGASGHGRYRGRHGVIAMSYTKSVARRYFLRDLFSILPPYEDKLTLIKKFLK